MFTCARRPAVAEPSMSRPIIWRRHRRSSPFIGPAIDSVVYSYLLSPISSSNSPASASRTASDVVMVSASPTLSPSPLAA